MYIITLYTVNYYEWHKFFFQIQYFEEHLCSEGAIYLEFMVADLCACCFIFSWLLSSVVADLYFSLKFSPEVIYHHNLLSLNKPQY